MEYASGAAGPVPQYLKAGLGSGSYTVNCHTNPGRTHAYAPLTGFRLFHMSATAIAVI
jgi:hypothetical protein